MTHEVLSLLHSKLSPRETDDFLLFANGCPVSPFLLGTSPLRILVLLSILLTVLFSEGGIFQMRLEFPKGAIVFAFEARPSVEGEFQCPSVVPPWSLMFFAF